MCSHSSFKRNNGFTLLELLIVVAILSSLSFMALTLLDNRSNDNRYDETRNKIEAIRLAIIGDPSRTVNGRTEVKGFISDIGRPPNCLADFFVATSSCGFGPFDLIDHEDFQIVGWRGPYLPGNVSDFRDGWGEYISVTTNVDSVLNPSSNGVLWSTGSTLPDTIVEISSLGRDRSVGSTSDPFDTDFQDNITTLNSYVPIKGLTVDFGHASGGCYGYTPVSGAGGPKNSTICGNATYNGVWAKSNYPFMHIKLSFPSLNGTMVTIESQSRDPNWGENINGTNPNPPQKIFFPMNSTSGNVIYVPTGLRSVSVWQNSTTVFHDDNSRPIPIEFVPNVVPAPVTWTYGKQVR